MTGSPSVDTCTILVSHSLLFVLLSENLRMDVEEAACEVSEWSCRSVIIQIV